MAPRGWLKGFPRLAAETPHLGGGSSFLLRRPKSGLGGILEDGRKLLAQCLRFALLFPFYKPSSTRSKIGGGSELGVDHRGWIRLSKPPLSWEGQQR